MEHPTRLEAPAAIAGFWKRIFAMFADSILLGAVGWLATYQFADWLIAFGPNGRIIGLGVSIAYFGVLNSGLGGGATLGKRLFGIRVVKRSGAKISLLRSLLRAVVYLLPLYLNGWFFSLPPLVEWQQIAFATADSVIVFGAGLAMIYLYLANVSTRQTLHDLVAGTFVVKAESAGVAVDRRIAGVHLVVVCVWLLIFLAGIPLGWRYIQSFVASNPFGLDTKGLTAVYDAVSAEPGVISTSVVENTKMVKFVGEKAETTTSLNVSVNLDHTVDEMQAKAEAMRIARRVLAVSPTILGRQTLNVTVRYGYDIGVWKQSQAYNYVDTPADWKTKMAPKPAAAAKGK